jgi:hypothetical protein
MTYEELSCKSESIEQIAKECGFSDVAELRAYSLTGAELLAMTPEQRQLWHDNCRKSFLARKKL